MSAYAARIELESNIQRLIDIFQDTWRVRVTEVIVVDKGWNEGFPEKSEIGIETEEAP